MTCDDFKRMVGVLKRIGVRTLDVMGGEPTLHPDLLRFIGHAEEQGMGLNISSNGSRPEVLSRIRDQYPAVLVGLSVNDHDIPQALVDLVRRKGLVVKTVVSKHPDSALIGRLLTGEPAELCLLYRDALEPGGLGEAPAFDEFHRTIRERYGPAIGMVHCSGFLPDGERYPVLRSVRCPAGTTKLGILPDGSVYPCNLFFRFPEFRLGNILTTPFEEIWQHPQLSFFRSFAGNRCPRRDCRLHARCHGGCPAHGFAHHGSLAAPDPRCVPQEQRTTGEGPRH